MKENPLNSHNEDKTPKRWIGKSYVWEDEESACEYFHDFSGDGCINVCIGNEPYSCHRAKKEGLCHKVIKNGN